MLLVCLLLLLVPFAQLAPLGNSIEDSTSFHPDCADPHNKEVACTVHLASCKDELLPPTHKGKEPPEPHDLRIEAFSKATARGKNSHQLHVDLSWQMPPKNESANLKAFRLEIVDVEGKKTCFNFNVSKFSFNEDAASPRFHFTSDSIFDFSKTYTATLFSLPYSKHKKPHVMKTKTMPANIEMSEEDSDNITEYCKTHSHPEASKWTAGFRKIFLQSVTRTIQLEFVGAPPQFCFEEYEIRLLDETGIEAVHFAFIKASEMKKEFIGNKWVSFGEHNFTDLESRGVMCAWGCIKLVVTQANGTKRTFQLDVDYIPSVIPVDTAADGRCLCPTSEQHGACSCIAADWKKVRLHRIQKPAIALNNTLPPVIIEPSKESEVQTIFYVIFILIASLALMCGTAFFVLYFCRKCKPVEKTTRIRFVGNTMNGNASAENNVPLIAQCKMSLLIIYSHDGPLHEAAVVAFAELLRNTFGFDVHLDAWDMEEIEQNLAEYVNSAIVRADKIIIINSLGAFFRTKAKHMREDPIERISPSPIDSLFAMQIDLALQHARVVSMRFTYTPSTCTIYSLTPLLQYSVPDNLGLLVASLADSTLKTDPRLNGYSAELSKLTNAVTKMADYVANEPKWFERLHHRVPPSEPERLHVSSPRKGVVVAPSSPMAQEKVPLIENDIEEEQEDEPEVVPAQAPESIPDEPMESGFYSETIQTMEEEEEEAEPVPREVLDKPRIPAATILEPKDPRHAENSGDSGIISDLQSAHIAA